MGILNRSLVGETFKMKLIAIACLFSSVFAEPEADPALVYTNSYVSPYVRTYGAYNPYTTYTGYLGHHLLGKRSADAEADPLLYSTYNNFVSPYTYGAYNPYTYSPYTYGAHMIGKRSADAEPDAEPFVYTNGYVSPYTYGAYRPATYAGVYRPAYSMWG